MSSNGTEQLILDLCYEPNKDIINGPIYPDNFHGDSTLQKAYGKALRVNAKTNTDGNTFTLEHETSSRDV